MAVDLHYFYGECNTPEAQAQIKENFIKLLNKTIFRDACQDRSLRDKCTPDNVNVTCGNVTSRERRASGIIMLHEVAFIYASYSAERCLYRGSR